MDYKSVEPTELCGGTAVSSELPILVGISLFKFKWRGHQAEHNTFYTEITRKEALNSLHFSRFWSIFMNLKNPKNLLEELCIPLVSSGVLCERDLILISSLWERFDRKVRHCPGREDNRNWDSIRMKTILFSWNRKYILIIHRIWCSFGTCTGVR